MCRLVLVGCMLRTSLLVHKNRTRVEAQHFDELENKKQKSRLAGNGHPVGRAEASLEKKRREQG